MRAPSVYWNWAQAASARGRKGEALWALLCAQALSPTDSSIGRELERLRAELGLDPSEVSLGLVGDARVMALRLRFDWLAVAAFLLSMISLFRKEPRRSLSLVSSLVGVLLISPVLAASLGERRGVVVQKDAPLVDRPSQDAVALANLREGEVVPLLGEERDYLRIQDASGARGFAHQNDVQKARGAVMAVQTLRFDGGALHLLDQRALPSEVRYVACRSAEETARAIKALVVRGAPAIGVAAAFGMALAAQRALEAGSSLADALEDANRVLAGSRPTAVNLFWALDQMRRVQRSVPEASGPALAAALLAGARKLLSDDLAACHAMGDFGAALLPEPARVLTHCNAGALATAGYGTALGVIRSAHRRGKLERVFAGETRPVLQGARLTAWELVNDQIPTTLITDSMAGFLMARGGVNCVVVGADRITANGDVVNKIGTYSLAVLAREHRIPFFVAAPRSTFDLGTLGCGRGHRGTRPERSPDDRRNSPGPSRRRCFQSCLRRHTRRPGLRDRL